MPDDIRKSIKFLISAYNRALAHNPIIDLYGDTDKAIAKIEEWLESQGDHDMSLHTPQDAHYNRFIDQGISTVREELDRVTNVLNAERNAVENAARDIRNDDAHRECLSYCDTIDARQNTINAAALDAIRTMEGARK